MNVSFIGVSREKIDTCSRGWCADEQLELHEKEAQNRPLVDFVPLFLPLIQTLAGGFLLFGH